jgi:alpha-galactosidase
MKNRMRQDYPHRLFRAIGCGRGLGRGLLGAVLALAAVAGANGFATQADAAPAGSALAATPPMGWNDWAHYECRFNAQTILDNAKALVKTGLAARGYNTVTIDDCWMRKARDAHGNLQPDTARFPQGMAAVAKAVHGMGLKFGIYEDSGYLTCGGFAGSGTVNGGGRDYFLQDAKLFASWGVDYLKLDGCNLYVPKGGSMNAVYRKAYAAEHAALQQIHRPIVFSESAPAYFQGTPDWYNVLSCGVRAPMSRSTTRRSRTARASTACCGTTPTTWNWRGFKSPVTGTMRTSSSAETQA